jgi:hypothetical protein
VTFPLSFSEQRLWFLDRLQPGTFVNNIPEAFRLKGSLNTDLFEQSIREITLRHEILKATFAELDGEPVNVVLPSQYPRLAIISHDANQPFDLNYVPLLRVTLLRLMEY